MTLFHAMRGTAEEAVASMSVASIRRVIYATQDKVDTFTRLVPWPALAASFQHDLDILNNALTSLGETHEPQDRQGPTRR